MAYPIQLSSITSEWLTSVLKGKLFANEDSVADFTSERLGEGQGFMSEIYRISMALNSGGKASVIAKLPNSLGKATGSNFDYFTTEVYFYAYYQVDSGRDCPFNIPKCYYVASDSLLGIPNPNGGDKPDVTNFCILMQDCHPTEVGDQVRGLSVEEVETGLMNLARFHAAWWKPSEEVKEDPQIKPWMSCLPLLQVWAPLLKMFYPGFTKYAETYIFKDGLHPVLKEVGDFLNTVLAEGQSFGEKMTVIHGDYRPDNMLFLREKKGDHDVEDFYAIDFQSLHLGNPMEDVAYLLSGGLSHEDLVKNQERLLHVYYDTLIGSKSEGQSGSRIDPSEYTFERARTDFREWLMYTLMLPIMSANTLLRQEELDSGELTTHQQRTRDLFVSWINRITAALILNDPRDILPEIKARHSSAVVKKEDPFDAFLDEDFKGILSYMNAALPAIDYNTHPYEKARENLAAYARMIEDQKKTMPFDQVGQVIDATLELEGGARKIPVRVYHPTDEQRKNAGGDPTRLSLYIHNGWVNGQGAGKLDDMTLRRWVAGAGQIVAALDHRLAPEATHAEILDDCWEVLRWLVQPPEGDAVRAELNVPVVKEVVLLGLYQGANLAVKLALKAIEQGLGQFLVKVIAILPYIDPRCSTASMETFATRSRVLERNCCLWSWKHLLQIPLDDPEGAEKLEAFAKDPAINLLEVPAEVLGKLPRTVVLAAAQSVLLDEINSFVHLLQQAGAPVDCRLFEGVGDGFFVNMVNKGREAIGMVGVEMKS